MNNDYSYIEVPVITQEAIPKLEEDHDHPIDSDLESSESNTLAELEAPAASNVNTRTLDWKSLITPIGTFVLGAVLALGHHAFNSWEDGKPVTDSEGIPQHWVTLIGVAFSFGFKSAVGATMGFVLLQCLWLSVVRQSLTIQQINIMYQIERRDQLYKTLLQALLFSPVIVAFSALTLLIPLSGVFAPGSLTVTTKGSTYDGFCMIPTGNLSTPNTPDFESLYGPTVGYPHSWVGVSPRAMALTTQCLVEQRIPDLPPACGPNCRYKVSVPSFVFQCRPNPSLLPYAQAGINCEEINETIVYCESELQTIWNGTTDPTSMWAFYVAWFSNGAGPSQDQLEGQGIQVKPGQNNPNGVLRRALGLGFNGTSGNASCSPVQALYDVEVETKNGVQSVTTSITQTTSPIPDVRNSSLIDYIPNKNMVNFWLQLASISYATQALFLGSIEVVGDMTFNDNRKIPGQPSFFGINGTSYFWGDVLKGIEEMSHNVTAAILTLSLGTMNSTCSFDQQVVVYQYNSVALLVPYGIALGIVLISLGVAVIIMTTNNTGDITTSFSDTVNLTRNLNVDADSDVSAGAKLRLRAPKDSKLEYTLE